MSNDPYDKSPSSTEERDAFKTALDAATGIRSAADNLAAQERMDEQFRSFEAIVASGAYGDPKSPAVMAMLDKARYEAGKVRLAAGLPAEPPAPKSAAERALEANTLAIPVGIHPNMQLMLDVGLKAIHDKGPMHVAQETDKLAEQLGRTTHAAMVTAAKAYLGVKYNDAVAAYLPALRVAAQLGRQTK